MAKSTLIIVGPGGVGKSPIDGLVRSDVIRLDPYRLRTDGPRDQSDSLYAPPKLHEELSRVFEAFDDRAMVKNADTETVEWYAKAGVLFFTVRGEWQFIIVPTDTGTLAKMEIYAPVLPTLLTINEFVTALGVRKIVVLNPAPTHLSTMGDWKAVEERTGHNCLERGDSDKSIQKRVKSVAVEAPFWRELVEKHGAIEAVDWQYPEYMYERVPEAFDKAKQCLLGLDGTLAEFF